MSGKSYGMNTITRCSIFIFLFWLLLTFPTDLKSNIFWKDLIEHLIIGGGLAFLIAWVTKGMLLSEDEASLFRFKYILRLIKYGLRLSIDILLAGIDVARRVMRKNILISPGIIEVDTPLKEDWLITINGNSITLTPGTITVDVRKTKDGSRFLVHCISHEAVKDIQSGGGFVERIESMIYRKEEKNA